MSVCQAAVVIVCMNRCNDRARQHHAWIEQYCSRLLADTDTKRSPARSSTRRPRPRRPGRTKASTAASAWAFLFLERFQDPIEVATHGALLLDGKKLKEEATHA